MSRRRSTVVIVTGISGAGKTQAIRFFEDEGFFCIDNLPVELFSRIVELSEGLSGRFRKMALGIDTRATRSFDRLFAFVRALRRKGGSAKIVFLDSKDSVLVRRFSESKRPHPLTREGGDVRSGLKKERRFMGPVASRADVYIDTSGYSISMLRNALAAEMKIKPALKTRMAVEVIAFGYKYGVPENADIVMDVRFLPNPFYVAVLKAKTGLSRPVRRFVMRSAAAKKFLRDFSDMLLGLLPGYLAEGKSSLTLAFGCTGGRHRSVAVAFEMCRKLSSAGYRARLVLRDAERPHPAA